MAGPPARFTVPRAFYDSPDQADRQAAIAHVAGISESELMRRAVLRGLTNIAAELDLDTAAIEAYIPVARAKREARKRAKRAAAL